MYVYYIVFTWRLTHNYVDNSENLVMITHSNIYTFGCVPTNGLNSGMGRGIIPTLALFEISMLIFPDINIYALVHIIHCCVTIVVYIVSA